MVMERGQSGLRRMGDDDLADELSGIQVKFSNRHTGMNDIPLAGSLPKKRAGAIALHQSLEGKINQETLTIGGKTVHELISELRQRRIRINVIAQSIMESSTFTTFSERQELEIIRLRVRDLDTVNAYATTEEIYKKAQELGLEFCPAEVGPQYRLQYEAQPSGEWIATGMIPVKGSDGRLGLFEVIRGKSGLWLGHNWAEPDYKWHKDREFIFCLNR